MRLEKLYKKLFIISFFIFLFSIGIYFVISPSRALSNPENRFLAQQPDLTIKGVADGTYFKAYEEYFSDQFPVRNLWLKTYLDIQRLSGKTFLNGYYVSPDGWIIPEPKYTFTEEPLKKASDSLNEFAKYASSEGSEIFLISLPHKLNTVTFKSPNYVDDKIKKAYKVTHAKKDYFFSLVSKEHIKQLDLEKIFKTKYTQARLNEMYYKTDHHWNTKGSFLGYQELTRYLEKNSKHFVKVTTEYKTTYYDTKFKGSYNRQLYDLVDLKTDKVGHILPKDNYFKEFKVTVDGQKSSFEKIYGTGINSKEKLNYTKLFTDDLGEIIIDNPKVKTGRVLIVKDSYANPITFHVAQHYHKTVVVDVRHLKVSLMEYVKQANSFDSIIFLYNDTNVEGPMLDFSKTP